MLVIGIDEDERQLFASCQLANEIGLAGSMDANNIDELGEKIGDLETNRLGLIDYITRVEIDGIDTRPVRLRVAPVQSSSDERAGKSRRCANLDDAHRSENARHGGQEKIVRGADGAGIMNASILDRTKKVYLARSWHLLRLP